MGLDVKQQQTFASSLSMLILASLAVILRFFARARSKAAFGYDDYFTLMALVFFAAFVGVSLWGSVKGITDTEYQLSRLVVSMKVTSPVDPIGSPWLTINSQALYINTYFAVLTISFAKFSVLALYYRIFSVHIGFRRAVIAAATVSLLWLLATLIMSIWKCVPIQAAWNPLIAHAKCYNIQRGFLITETINCVTDLAIVCLPVGMVRKLQLPLRHKIALSLVFLLGGFVCLTSIIRIIFTYKPAELNLAMINSVLWLDIQLSSAILCACLPTYKSILPKGTYLSAHLKHWYHRVSSSRSRSSKTEWRSREYANESGGSLAPPRHGPYKSFGDENNDRVVLTEVKADFQDSSRNDYPINAINVTNDVKVVRESSLV